MKMCFDDGGDGDDGSGEGAVDSSKGRKRTDRWLVARGVRKQQESARYRNEATSQ